jgi:hypothetical protein
MKPNPFEKIIDYPSLFAQFEHKHDYDLGELAEMARKYDVKIVCAESPFKGRSE